MTEKTYIYNLGQLFEKIALKNQSSVAVKSMNGHTTTYGELDRLSNQIAHFLSERNLRKGDVVAILNNKSSLSFGLMLACIKSGIIYTNLDPNSPPERFRKMLGVCSPSLLFYPDDERFPAAQEPGTVNVVDYTSESFLQELMQLPVALPECNHLVASNNPAYIMFTSGSTGFPKGVLISHASVIHFINWSKLTYGTSESDVFTNLNPMHFDNSVFDFYASLFTGASILPIRESVTIQPRKLLNELNRLQPTIWFSVPSMLVYVLNTRALKPDDLPDLRVVTFGGEGFPKNKLRELWKFWGHRVRFINVYGPTECTCICSSYPVTESDLNNDDLLPLGPVAPNFTAFIMTEDGNLMENGEIGELCLGGPNVGLGYFNNPEKTSEVFIDNPQVKSHKEKIYKTGDLAVYEKAKDIFLFKGRKDNQIKRMGYRIELEEIENALNTLGFIEESAVIYVDNHTFSSKIIACLKSKEVEIEKIRAELENHLPKYMMPDIMEFYDDLPKNQNGKIDRIQLKKMFNS